MCFVSVMVRELKIGSVRSVLRVVGGLSSISISMHDLDFTFSRKLLGLSKFLLAAAGSVSVTRFLQDDSAAIDTEGAVADVWTQTVMLAVITQYRLFCFFFITLRS